MNERQFVWPSIAIEGPRGSSRARRKDGSAAAMRADDSKSGFVGGDVNVSPAISLEKPVVNLTRRRSCVSPTVSLR